MNKGVNASIFANAYTNALDGMTASATLQFALDSKTDSLVTLANNSGMLSTIAKITLGGEEIDFSNKGGFDIVSMSEDDNLAIALLTVKGKGAGIYEIDLSNGMATFIGDPGKGNFTSFAAQNTVAAVPLPATALLMIGGLGLLTLVRRRIA